MSDQEMRNIARNLRKNQTLAESLLWSKLRSRQLSGFKFRRQYPLDKNILDFYCIEAHLAIEIDGGQHADNTNVKRDNLRTEHLNKKGIRVIRFWNDDVLKHLDEVIAEINATLNEIIIK